jgi:hypothetical protein
MPTNHWILPESMFVCQGSVEMSNHWLVRNVYWVPSFNIIKKDLDVMTGNVQRRLRVTIFFVSGFDAYIKLVTLNHLNQQFDRF